MRKLSLSLAALAVGCSTQTSEPTSDAPARPIVAEFEGVLDAEKGTFQITTIASSHGGLQPLVVDQDGVPGNPSPGTVELVTSSVGPCNGPNSFGGSVTINSGYLGALTNLFAHITTLSPVTNAQAFGPDSFPGFNNALGLWFHGTPGNARTWCYDLLAGTQFVFRGVVYADVTPPSNNNPNCAANPLWQPVTCSSTAWVWSSDRVGSTSVPLADANQELFAGCNHGGGDPNGFCSLDGTGFVSTQQWFMQGCNATWAHLTTTTSFNCGGHDTVNPVDIVRRLTMNPNGCYDYTLIPPPGPAFP